jgi:hypothetical protein
MNRFWRLIAAAGVLAALPASAQWLNRRTPGIPRAADGKPNLSAPAPRAANGKPDLSGLWQINAGSGYVVNIAADLPADSVQPWADALYQKRVKDLGVDDPWTVQCLPLGPRQLVNGGIARILQTPALIAILYEDLTYRQIFLDGRELPRDPNPTWQGYSVGHWDGDTLVVESTGYTDRSWMDMGGHPHSEALRVTERFHRRDFGHLDLDVTFDDPKAYSKPWTVNLKVNLAPDTEMLEYVCAENEKDRSHLVGRTAEEKKVTVAPEILAKYVGIYEAPGVDGNTGVATRFTVTLAGDQLFIDIGGKGNLPLTPLSETTFSPRLLGTYEFVKNAQGVVTHLVAYSTEGDVHAVKLGR